MLRRHAFVVALALGGHAAFAQPAPEKPDKSDAQALVASGIKLYGAKDYLGALAVFRDAYGRFPSTKILLNIATTLARLDRDAEAANTYQHYLDASDADPGKRAGVEKALAELDRKLAVITVTVSPADAEVQIGDGDWLPVASVAHYRVTPGEVVVHARGKGFEPGLKTIHVDAGGELAVTVTLAAVVVVRAPIVRPPPPPPPPHRARIGALAIAHVAVEHPGAAGIVGVTVDATPWLAIEGAALIGPTSGGYAAITVAPWMRRARPFLVVGAPVFVSDGARVALRGGLGLELQISPHLSLIAEVAGERAFNPEPSVERYTFVPALGVTGRL